MKHRVINGRLNDASVRHDKDAICGAEEGGEVRRYDASGAAEGVANGAAKDARGNDGVERSEGIVENDDGSTRCDGAGERHLREVIFEFLKQTLARWPPESSTPPAAVKHLRI